MAAVHAATVSTSGNETTLHIRYTLSTSGELGRRIATDALAHNFLLAGNTTRLAAPLQLRNWAEST